MSHFAALADLVDDITDFGKLTVLRVVYSQLSSVSFRQTRPILRGLVPLKQEHRTNLVSWVVSMHCYKKTRKRFRFLDCITVLFKVNRLMENETDFFILDCIRVNCLEVRDSLIAES